MNETSDNPAEDDGPLPVKSIRTGEWKSNESANEQYPHVVSDGVTQISAEVDQHGKLKDQDND